MPEISFNESCRQGAEIAERAEACKRRKDWAGAIVALYELLDHPCAHHLVAAADVWDEAYELHRRLGEYDLAIDAKTQAIAAGYRSEPDPMADVAECHLLAGRTNEGDALFAELRARAPDDVWLYNSAGFAYAEIAEHAESARWFRDGIDVALRTGDPDRVAFQLLDGLEAAWAALGAEPERGLRAQVATSADRWTRPPGPVGRRWDEVPPVVAHRCTYRGWDPDGEREPEDDADQPVAWWPPMEDIDTSLGPSPARVAGRRGRATTTLMAVAWFPRGEWEAATARWPELLEGFPADHAEYSRAMEGRLKRLARSAPGQTVRVAAMTLDGLVAHCAEEDEDAGSGQGRSGYAAHLAVKDEVLPWPPGRNEPCWCGSGQKYKRCCGPAPAASV